MSRKATMEYISNKRLAYTDASYSKRKLILDEVCETTGYERKYANKLLTGNRKFRNRPKRGPTYSDAERQALIAIWRTTGCICTTYLKASIKRWTADYEQHIRILSQETRDKLHAMSASTMDRLLKGVKRTKTGSVQRNRRSGVNNKLKQSIPCVSGEEIMACKVPPGDTQVDTFALGGGIGSGDFYWILNLTDRKTQWTRMAPAWNRGEATTLAALKHAIAKFPFEIYSLHADNGGEFINYHVARALPQLLPKGILLRSRPIHCNDNAHIEEKNKAVGRDLLGERRIDCRELEKELTKLCDDQSDYYNFCRPCKMLERKIKSPSGKGYSCYYDKPITPCERILKEPNIPETIKEQLRAKRDSISGIELRWRIVKRLKKIIRMQDEYTAKKRQMDSFRRGIAAFGSSLRDAPSGSPSACDTPIEIGGINLKPNTETQKEQRHKSVQYLTNRKQAYESNGVLYT